jgi:hypothetical protein
MPQAQIIDLADSIVAELNAHAFSEPFRAERGYLPTFELSDLNVLRITVVPNQDDGRLDTRGASIHEYTVDIGIQIKPKDVTSQYLDPYVYLTQEIVDFFRFGKEPGGTSLVSPRTRVLYVQDHLQKFRQFTSVVTLTFKGWREASGD